MVHTRTTRRNGLGLVYGISLTLCFLVLSGCKQQPPPKPVTSEPAKETTEGPVSIAPKATPPQALRLHEATPSPAASKPAASRPAATMPASTYDSKPPYAVQLYVRSPQDKQPGWLTVLELIDRDQWATVRGSFPEQNRITIDTDNVRQIRIHASHLPLAPNKRLVLNMDGQAMEINRKRQFTIMNRQLTGEWIVIKSPKE